ncbi:nitrogenase cofactor biosynthesis protein NifB [Thermicanus aegyptius]|uniref:nitrogenase cofactor biosynthesis protein NifB n=1 Tax=Thermicanus aegyptius TaxID=94009 RepID=UPI0005878590|nr:nitrogenase cofactor biosynthesis protein NifB [Thermicanus aegyptius]
MNENSCSMVEGTGAHGKSTLNLPEEVVNRVKRHPCYSEEAHHFFARLHVAVAPACNIQCKYCNRKYDCVNESRPGVTSEVLTPEEAVEKVLAVGTVIKQTSVVGIAGPGDPLANPKRTFKTFSLLREKAPDMKLCLSTNGLALPDYIDAIKELGIDHVTITINAVDPEIGKHIYRYVVWKGKKLTGYDAAAVLLERQLTGLEKLVENDILVKVNSVLIPGINDAHMKEVSQIIRKKGAFLHNIMPLIIADGSDFEREGRRPALMEDVALAQQSCERESRLMRHCRQCRADAVGLLGEERSEEFTKEKVRQLSATYDVSSRQALHAELDERIEKMKEARKKAARLMELRARADFIPFNVAVATKGDGKVNQHFGQAKEFQIFEVSRKGLKFITVRRVSSYCSGKETCGDHIERMGEIAGMLGDCRYLLCKRIGTEPMNRLREYGIESVMANGSIDDELLRLAERQYPVQNQV